MNNAQATEISEKFKELYNLTCEAEKLGDKDAAHIAEMLYRYVRPRILHIRVQHNVSI